MKPIVGRADEVGVLDGFLADTYAEPRAVLLDGEPGIGKTTLLQYLHAAARERGYTVLSHRPSRSEMDLSYVGLVELLGGIDDTTLDRLPAPQARVLRMVLRREESDEAFDRLSLSVAVVAVLRSLAASGPVLLAVDDIQWLDSPSARTLAFVVRRLAGTAARLAVVRSFGSWAASTSPGDDPVDWSDALVRAMPAGRLHTIRVGPIDVTELSRILRRTLGWVPVWPRVQRIAELSAGNPLYAIELARSFASGFDPDASVPDSAIELARSRIARLPDATREAVELASVQHAPTLDLLRRLHPGATESLLPAVRGGIVTVDAERVRFVHPVLAAAAYGSIPSAHRRELHRAVAMLSDDLEERARHLAIAADGPDSEVASTLQEAAEQAWRRGAPDAAADLLRRSCRLTPASDTSALALRRIAYGRLLHSAGDVPNALNELASVVASLPPGVLRARALFHQMYVLRLSGSLGRSMSSGVQAAAEAAADPLFQAEVYELLSRLSDNDIARKLDTARKAVAAIASIAVPDPDVVFQVQGAMLEAEFYAGLGIHLNRLDGLDPGSRRQFPPTRTATRGDDLIGRLLTYEGRIEEGLALLRGLYERAAVEGRSILPATLGWMAEAELMAGRFAVAAELTRQSIERAEEIGHSGGYPWEVGFHAVALVMLGRLDEAFAVATPVAQSAQDDPSIGLDSLPALLALGLVALARGEFHDAVVPLRRLDELKRTAGIRDPRICAHASELFEALLGAGLVAEASEVLARFAEEAETSTSPWSLAASSRCRALLLAGDGQLDSALASVESALPYLDALPMPFERARTVFVLGQLRRRRKEKRKAREALEEALASFVSLGTAVWAERARNELARIPQRQGVAGLTPTEEAIARLAAAGLSNKDIADRTFLSPKTVESNLTRIYRKVGVRSRAALASLLANDGERRQP